MTAEKQKDPFSKQSPHLKDINQTDQDDPFRKRTPDAADSFTYDRL